MNYWRKVRSDAGVYLGVLFYDKDLCAWVAEDRLTRLRGFNAESWAEAWLMRQVERAEAA